MATSFCATQQDVGQYRRLRAAALDLNYRIAQTIPQRAYREIGDAIGIRHNGVLVFETEDMKSVVMDCCVFDWLENGKNHVRHFAESHVAGLGPEESSVLAAYLQAQYRILVVESLVPDAGVHCRDILNKERLFLMDVAFSRSLTVGNTIATRTVPFGDYWITTGAALPIPSSKTVAYAFRGIERESLASVLRSGVLPLRMVRACLAAGAAEYIQYDDFSGKSRPPQRQYNWPRTKKRRR